MAMIWPFSGSDRSVINNTPRSMVLGGTATSALALYRRRIRELHLFGLKVVQTDIQRIAQLRQETSYEMIDAITMQLALLVRGLHLGNAPVVAAYPGVHARGTRIRSTGTG